MGLVIGVAVVIVAAVAYWWFTRANTVNSRDGLNYVWIEPGTFEMGCSPGDGECVDSEKPVHLVTITKGLWMGQTPVTQAAYRRVIGKNYASGLSTASHFQGDHRPVESVNWDDASAYCSAIGMRLPTEAEWEYAARAGSTASRYGDINAIAWYGINSGGQTHDVAQKQPNAWKLYDMLGNVWQWTADWHDRNYYSQSPSQDPHGPVSGQQRVLRGGGWGDVARVVRVSDREVGLPNIRFIIVGFRCVGEALP
jgi:formylglycine-generating enzyme required for sulfatase activity